MLQTSSTKTLPMKSSTHHSMNMTFYKVLSLFLLLISSFYSTLSAQNLITWDGSTSSDWHTASNWTPAQVPSTQDIVIIPNVLTNNPICGSGMSVASIHVQSEAKLTFSGNNDALYFINSCNNVGFSNDGIVIIKEGTLKISCADETGIKGIVNNGKFEVESSGSIKLGGTNEPPYDYIGLENTKEFNNYGRIDCDLRARRVINNIGIDAVFNNYNLLTLRPFNSSNYGIGIFTSGKFNNIGGDDFTETGWIDITQTTTFDIEVQIPHGEFNNRQCGFIEGTGILKVNNNSTLQNDGYLQFSSISNSGDFNNAQGFVHDISQVTDCNLIGGECDSIRIQDWLDDPDKICTQPIKDYICEMIGNNPITIVFVDSASSAPFPDGTSWTQAYPDLQLALDHARCASGRQTIWIAKGTYRPTRREDGYRDRTDYEKLTFSLSGFEHLSEIKIYGGFAGDEDPLVFNLHERDFVTNETILSGKHSVGQHIFYSRNVIIADVLNVSIIDGLTISDGRALGSGNLHTQGGGINIDRSSGVISNCIFKNNQSSGLGAGLFAKVLADDTLHVINCLFQENISQSRGSGAHATYSGANSTVNFINCTFFKNNNINLDGGSPETGGGISTSSISNGANQRVNIFNTILWDNFPDQVYHQQASNIKVQNSLIQGSLQSGWNFTTHGSNLGGNKDEDPQFVSTVSGFFDLHLKSSSPAVNAGEPTLLSSQWQSDVCGNERIFDGVLDMGAYESYNQDTSLAILLTCDQVVGGNTSLTFVDSITNCNVLQEAAKGKWFKFVGTGTDITFSLCYNTDYDSKISVFDETGTCVITDDDAVCGSDSGPSEVTYTIPLDKTYYILVYGFNLKSGSFTIVSSCACDDSNLVFVSPDDDFQLGDTWFYETDGKIEASNTHFAGSDIRYSAEDSVMFNSGFIVDSSAILTVDTIGCVN